MHKPICQGCDKESEREYVRANGQLWHDWIRHDAYGIPVTNTYCDKCYNSNDPDKYPYRKDRYHDPAYAGESLDYDY